MIYRNSNLNNFLENFFNHYQEPVWTSTVTKSTSEEPYEINQTKDGAYLFFEAPGFNKTNLKVDMEGGVLFIEGKRTYKLNGKESSKSISKQFKIGSDYNESSIEATIEDGILTVFVPNYKKSDKKRINLL